MRQCEDTAGRMKSAVGQFRQAAATKMMDAREAGSALLRRFTPAGRLQAKRAPIEPRYFEAYCISANDNAQFKHLLPDLLIPTQCYVLKDMEVWCNALFTKVGDLQCPVLQVITTLQGTSRYYTALQGTTSYYKVLQGISRCYKVLQGITMCYKVVAGVAILGWKRHNRFLVSIAEPVLLLLWEPTLCNPVLARAQTLVLSKSVNNLLLLRTA